MPFNVAHDFAATTHLILPGTTHGLATPALLIHVYDNQTPAQRIDPGDLTVDASTADIHVYFGQAQAGYLAIHPAKPAVGSNFNYERPFTNAQSLTIPASQHGLLTKALLIEVRDAQEPSKSLTPGRVTVHPTTFAVTIEFAQPTSGTVIICGAYGPGSPSVFPFAMTDTVAVPGSAHGLGTARIVWGIYTATTPAHIFAPQDVSVAVTVNGNVLVTFGQQQSGTLLLSGSTEQLVFSRAVSTGIVVGASPTVYVPVLRPRVTQALALGTLTVFGSTKPIVQSAGLLVGSTVGLRIPLLRRAVVDNVALSDTVLRRGLTLRRATTTALSLGETVLRRGLTLRRATTSALGVGTVVTLRLPILRRAVQDPVALGGISSFSGARVLQQVAPLRVLESVTLRGLRLLPTVTQSLAVDAVPVLQLRLRVIPLADLMLTGEETSVQVGNQVRRTEALALGETVLRRGLILRRQVTTGLGLQTLATVRPASKGLTVTGLQVGDSATVRGLRLRRAVTDSIAVATTVSTRQHLFPRITAPLALGTVVTRLLRVQQTVTSSLGVGATVVMHQRLYMAVSPAVTLSDTVMVAPLSMRPSVTASVFLGQTVTAFPTTLHLAIVESVRLTDRVEIFPPFLPGLMLLDDLGLLLEQAGLGTLSTTIFKGQIPLDAPFVPIQDALIGLVEVPGFPPMRAHDAPARRYEQPVVQVIIRGQPHAYHSARQLADEAWMLLDGLANQRLNGTHYLWIQGLQSPYWLRTDDFHRPLITFTVRVAKQMV